MINTKDIRNDVVTRLTGNTAVGANVINSKVTPNMMKSLPAICVYTPTQNLESVDPRELGGLRTIDLQIEVLVASSTSWADTLDDIMLEIKTVLYGSASFLDQFENVNGYTEQHTLSDEGEQPVGLGILTLGLELFEAIDAT